jgi:hypothetical protein
MTYRIVLIALIAILISIGLSDCSSPQFDEAVPSISLLSPTEGANFLTGTTLPIQLTCTDDFNLNDYQVQVYTNEMLDMPTFWDTTVQKKILGQMVDLNLNLPIPLYTPTGSYTMQVFCTDKFDNSSDTVSLNFNLQNAIDNELPTLNLNSVPAVDTVVLFTGNNIVILGDVFDNSGLLRIAIKLYRYPNNTLYYEHPIINLDALTEYLLYETILPLSLGYYRLEIRVTDVVNNNLVKSVILKVI